MKLPILQWLPAEVRPTHERTPGILKRVLTQFGVETHERYRPVMIDRKLVTYCNIYRWDATAALGCEVPHWYNPTTGKPTKHHAPGSREMRANTVEQWMRMFGREYSWRLVSRAEAQTEASHGKPVVVNWYNPKGHGHEALMMPDGSVIQAGARCGVFQLEQVFPQPLAVTYWSRP